MSRLRVETTRSARLDGGALVVERTDEQATVSATTHTGDAYAGRFDALDRLLLSVPPVTVDPERIHRWVDS